jgi:hypothetical protein
MTQLLEKLVSPVTLTPAEVTSSPLTVQPGAVDIAIDVPAGTTARVQTATGVTFDRTEGISLNCNGRAMSNTFIISRQEGSGTILVIVARRTDGGDD